MCVDSIDNESIDFQEISESLSKINPFIQRKFASLLTTLFVLEIPAAGEPSYKHRQIREIYREVVAIGADAVAAEGKDRGGSAATPGGAGSNAVMNLQPSFMNCLFLVMEQAHLAIHSQVL